MNNKTYLVRLLLIVVFFLSFFVSTQKVFADVYTVSTGGLTDSTAGGNQRKLVRTSNGDFHTVYHKLDSDGYYQIYYASSTDNGHTWNEMALINSPLVTSISHDNRPTIVSDSNDNLYVVWWGKSSVSPTYNQIRYIKFDHNTNTWGSVIDLTSGDYEQNSTSVTVDSNDNVYIAWNGKSADSANYLQIRFIKYTFSTNSWGSVTNVTNEGYDQNRPFIATDYDDNIHMVWWGKSDTSTLYTQIRYKKFDNSSQTWSAITDITSGNYTQDFPSLAVDFQNNVHVAWRGTYASSPTVAQIKYKKYEKATDSWSDVTTFSNEQYSKGQYNTFVSVDSNDYVHIAWNGRVDGVDNNYVIRYIVYTNSWSSIENLTSSVSDSQYPNLIWSVNPVVNGLRINRPKTGYAFVWSNTTDIKFYASSDLTWDTAPQDLSAPVISSGYPSGTLPVDTVSVTLSLTTNESATCRYSTSENTSYNSMTEFSVTGGTAHSFEVSNLHNGMSYVYYVKCSDNSGNINASDYNVSFSVSPPSESKIAPNYAGGIIDITLNPIQNTVVNQKKSPYLFTRDLKYGMKGDDVRELQHFLNTNNYTVEKFGPGSLNNETTFFGPSTLYALKLFQKNNNIVPAFGYFGPITRGVFDSLNK